MVNTRILQVCQNLVWWEEYSSHIGSYNAITLGRQSLRRTSGGMKWNLPTGSKMTQLLGCLLDASHLAWSTYLLPDVQFKINFRNTRINRIFFFSFWKYTILFTGKKESKESLLFIGFKNNEEIVASFTLKGNLDEVCTLFVTWVNQLSLEISSCLI